jgi:16S rRNA (uracil1498-N3)-methyltransferase
MAGEESIGPIRYLSIDTIPQTTGVLTLPAGTERHLRVLRLGVGSRVRLVDGRGNRADAGILAVGKEGVICEISSLFRAPLPERRVVLVQALPKASKIETIVRMTTELGVHAIHLAVSERSVPKIKEDRFSLKVDRLERIALEACVQSEQPYSPEIHEPVSLLDAARRAPDDARRLVFWERSTQDLDTAFFGFSDFPLRSVTVQASNKSAAIVAKQQYPREGLLRSHEEIWAVVGPEGGLSQQEIELLAAIGYKDVGLGRALFRVESAAPVIVALILDRLGRFRFIPEGEHLVPR